MTDNITTEPRRNAMSMTYEERLQAERDEYGPRLRFSVREGRLLLAAVIRMKKDNPRDRDLRELHARLDEAYGDRE